jgi:hypothetical protein
MSERKFMVDEGIVKTVVATVPNQVIAELAADGKAECDMFTCEVKDALCPEIVVGHALLIIVYGSEMSCDRAKQAILSTSSDVAFD